jgi:hypothetical protein
MRIFLTFASMPRMNHRLVMALLLVFATTGCMSEPPPALEGPDRHALGSADSPVTLVAFDDYQ